ncbi:DNA-directed DNA polymerase [Tanacetum coccineum]
MAGQAPPQGPIPDLRSMEELLQAPTDGVEDAIVVPPILAIQFELKTGLLNLVTAISFHGFKNDDPHSHIRQPPNSITTWNDLVSKFVNHFFPPSKTTNLRNEITRFQQRFGETFAEAWDRFKDLLNKCPHHGFSPLHQIDTFYNSLSQADHDSLNSAAGGNFLTKNTQEALTIIENKSKVQTSRNKPQVASASGSSAQDAHISSLTKQVEALLALHRPVDSTQNGVNSIQNGSITTRSGVTLAGPSVPPPISSSKEVDREQDDNGPIRINLRYQIIRLNKEKLQGKADIQIHSFLHMFKKIHFNISFAEALAHMPKFAKMIKDLLTNKEKLLEMANTPLNENCSAVLLKKLPEKLGDTRGFSFHGFSPPYGLESCMALADLGASINLMPLSVWKTLSLPDLSTTRMTLKLATRTVTYPAEIAEDVFVQVGSLPSQLTLWLLTMSTMTSEGDILFLEELLNEDPTPNIPPIPHPVCLINETEKIKSSIDDPPDLELKDLPLHLEYAYLEGTSKLPVIIVKDLKREEKEQLLKVLKSHKRAIAWKISDIRGIDPNFCTHKILMEDDFKPAVQHQRRVNPKIHEVIKAEVIKLLDAGLIYPISDSPWVSPIHVVPKKGGMTVITNENNVLIPTRFGYGCVFNFQ